MKRSMLIIALAASMAALSAAPALAKGGPGEIIAGSASITGPGLSSPITFSGKIDLFRDPDAVMPDSGEHAFEALLVNTGLLPWGLSGRGTFGLKPADSTLGPRYEIRTWLSSQDTTSPVVQYLYPYAAGGPKVFAPSVQHLMGAKVPSAWWSAPTALLTSLTNRGLAVTAPAALAIHAPVAPAPTPAPASRVWLVWLVVGGLLGLIVADLVRHRRRGSVAA
jgi:hypothetical protein